MILNRKSSQIPDLITEALEGLYKYMKILTYLKHCKCLVNVSYYHYHYFRLSIH